MKLPVKKIFCRSCRRLVKGREQKTNSNTSILCSRCGEVICSSDGIGWRYT